MSHSPYFGAAHGSRPVKTTMSDWTWGNIPAGFSPTVRGAGFRMIVRDDVASFFPAELCVKTDASRNASGFEGRGQLRALDLANGDTALIRAYHHGGIFRGMTKRVFCSWPPRPFRELAITEELRRRGIPTVEVYGACVDSLWGPFYRGWLITRELRGARNLWAAFASGFVGPANRDAVLRAVAAALRAMHRGGVYHRDLNMKNILVREEGGGMNGYVIDFDRSRLFLSTLPQRLAERNLARLLRSARKLDPEQKYITADAWSRLVGWYRDTQL